MSLDPKSTYYDAGGIEVNTVIKAKLTPEQYEGWLLGNVIAYSLRLNHKGTPERDAEKLANYSLWLRDHLQQQPEVDGPCGFIATPCGNFDELGRQSTQPIPPGQTQGCE